MNNRGEHYDRLHDNRLHELQPPTFREPTSGEKVFNRLFGFLVALELGFSYNYLLQVSGRKTGKLYSTPINVVELKGQRYLVAPVDEGNGCATPKSPAKSL